MTNGGESAEVAASWRHRDGDDLATIYRELERVVQSLAQARIQLEKRLASRPSDAD